MGGIPGCSIEHYIVKMFHFILSKMDGVSDSAVLAVPVDYSKAYNRMLHSDILCNLVDLNVPPCATKLIRSYLSSRSMCVRYMGATSTFQSCPGGGPQGGLLTGVLFCLQVNKAGSPCPLPELPSFGLEGHHTPAIHPTQSNTEHPSSRQVSLQGPTLRPIPPQEENRPLCHKKENLHKKSYIDDLTLLEKISLSQLIQKYRIMGPLDFHDRFNLALPPDKSILQHQLQDLVRFTKEHSMVLNSKKTKCMPFVNSLTKDFMPQLSIEPGNHLEVIYQLKLVGVVLTSDMTWNAQINYTVNRVSRTLWQLVIFKQLGASQEKLKTFYILKIRSILMFASVCFHSSLTSEMSQKLELKQ